MNSKRKISILNAIKKSSWLHEYGILIFIATVSYALMLPGLGWYYDDWPFAWISARLSPLEFFPAFLPFRPFLSPIYALTTLLIPASPILWHFFNILVRIMLSVSVAWTIRQIFPNHKQYGLWAALFTLIFPGFNQQFVSITHSNQELIPHIFQITSIGLMAKLARKKFQWNLWFSLSLLFAAVGIFSTEYFLTLEFIRPVVLWIVSNDQSVKIKKRLLYCITRWLPYLSILFFNLVWLIFYYNSPYYDSYSISIFSTFKNEPIQFILNALGDFINSFSLASYKSWFEILDVINRPLNELSTYLGLFVSILVFIIFWFVFKKATYAKIDQEKKEISETKNEGLGLIILGIVLVLLGRIPSWAAGFPLSREFPYDRLMMPMMVGSSLLLIGTVVFFVTIESKRRLMFIAILSLSAGLQMINANSFRRSWDIQTNFFQQLRWRIPGLQKDSVLVTHETGIPYVTDNSLSAAVNWMYDSQNRTRDMDFMLIYSKARLNTELLPDLDPSTRISFGYRTLNYSGLVGDSIVFYFPSNGCLRILDPLYTPEDVIPDIPYQLKDLIHLSNLERILDENQTATMPTFFRDSPERNWCFYFQKAELARQFEDWNEVINAYRSIKKNGFVSQVSSEYLVFLEGFLNTRNYSEADQLIGSYLFSQGIPADGLCYTMDRIKRTSEDSSISFIKTLQEKYECLQ